MAITLALPHYSDIPPWVEPEDHEPYRRVMKGAKALNDYLIERHREHRGMFQGSTAFLSMFTLSDLVHEVVEIAKEIEFDMLIEKEFGLEWGYMTDDERADRKETFDDEWWNDAGYFWDTWHHEISEYVYQFDLCVIDLEDEEVAYIDNSPQVDIYDLDNVTGEPICVQKILNYDDLTEDERRELPW